MFGYVTASWKELTAEEQKRYGAGVLRHLPGDPAKKHGHRKNLPEL